MKRTANMIYKPSDEARELVLYAENDHDIYFGHIKPVIENLAKKMKKGVYDSNKAVDLWYYVATDAAKKYNKEFGYMFTVTERFTAAVALEERFIEDVKWEA